MSHYGMELKNHWKIECFDVNGLFKWVEEFDNLIVTAGLNKILDACFKTGLAAPAWYVGLVVATPTYDAADIMSSHAGWTTSTSYSNATNPAFTPGAIASGSVDNSAAKASFNINGTATIAGAFLSDSNTKGGTTGTLYGEGNFTGGNRSVVSGDTLNVTVTLTATSV